MEIFFIIGCSISIYYLLVTTKILVEQYYSLLRMYRSKILVVKKRMNYYMTYLVFFLGGIMLYILNQDLISFTLILLVNYISIIEISLKNYHFTRRNILLLSISIIISIVLLVYVYFNLSFFFGVILTLIIPNISLIIAYYLLLPLENLIKKHYIKKARNKVLKNNYIVIGVTGSFGKTTTKNFIYSLLKDDYLISKQNHNYNTLMGLCKYINNEVNDEDEVLLVELGVDHPHSMINFKKLFELDYAIVTSIGEMHLATFKSLDNITREKLSIRELLKKTGKIYLSQEIVDKYPNYLNFDYEIYSNKNLKYTKDFYYYIQYNNSLIKTPFLIKKQLSSLAIAIEIAEELKVSKQKIPFLISTIEIPQRRLNCYQYDNFLVIDNSYNGNLEGIKEILESIKDDKRYKIALTGGLIELGKKYTDYNIILGEKLNVMDKVFLISNDKNHPLEKYLKSEKLIKVNSYIEAFQELKQYQEESILLLLSKGSNVFLQ